MPRRAAPAYAFPRRLDRRRLALRLARGMAATEAAAIERAPEGAIRELLGDSGFRSLIHCHRALLDLTREARVERLGEEALDLLQLALVAGDVRVAIFFRYERLHGRDPSLTLALAVERAVVRLGLPPASAEPPRSAPLPSPLPEGRPRRDEDDFPFCAATLPTAEQAAALATDEAARFARRLAAQRRNLAAQVLAEVERSATVAPGPSVERAALRRFAVERHGAALQSMQAATRLAAHRARFAADGASRLARDGGPRRRAGSRGPPW